MKIKDLYIQEQVIICENCKGYGKTEHTYNENYHDNICDYYDEPCIECNGLGRLLVNSSNQPSKDSTIKRNIITIVKQLTKEEIKIRKK